MPEPKHTHEYEDRRAHARISDLESTVEKIHAQIAQFDSLLTTNTNMTAQIVKNTAELVVLVKGAKGLRAFAVWVAPLALFLSAVWVWIKSP